MRKLRVDYKSKSFKKKKILLTISIEGTFERFNPDIQFDFISIHEKPRLK